MDVKYLKIIILAAVSDGEIQKEELDYINFIKKSHPHLKEIDDSLAQEVLADIYNKISAGMETKHILEQLRGEFSDEECHSAYALAKEICASDFKNLPAETEFLNLMEELWEIPDKIKYIVNESISLRYSI